MNLKWICSWEPSPLSLFLFSLASQSSRTSLSLSRLSSHPSSSFFFSFFLFCSMRKENQNKKRNTKLKIHALVSLDFLSTSLFCLPFPHPRSYPSLPSQCHINTPQSPGITLFQYFLHTHTCTSTLFITRQLTLSIYLSYRALIPFCYYSLHSCLTNFLVLAVDVRETITPLASLTHLFSRLIKKKK